MTQTPIVYSEGDRKIIDTRLPHANMVNDASRPFAVVDTIGRVTNGRYATLANAKKALRRLKLRAEVDDYYDAEEIQGDEQDEGESK